MGLPAGDVPCRLFPDPVPGWPTARAEPAKSGDGHRRRLIYQYGHDYPNEPDLVSYYIGYLDRYLAAKLPVFDCEYALTYADSAHTNALGRGYVPYVSRRSLGRLTTTPPPGY